MRLWDFFQGTKSDEKHGCNKVPDTNVFCQGEATIWNDNVGKGHVGWKPIFENVLLKGELQLVTISCIECKELSGLTRYLQLFLQIVDHNVEFSRSLCCPINFLITRKCWDRQLLDTRLTSQRIAWNISHFVKIVLLLQFFTLSALSTLWGDFPWQLSMTNDLNLALKTVYMRGLIVEEM